MSSTHRDPHRMPRAPGQRARGNSRTSSSTAGTNPRNSASFQDDLLATGGAAPSYARHVLRPAESRFSLNEQFAATRREIEFGFDDASSFIGTLASVGDPADQDDTLRVDVDAPSSGAEFASSSAAADVSRDYYELLCLARDSSALPEQVRKAYRRLFRILDSERQPPALRQAAVAYFAEVQEAFETLVEPSRRLEYDRFLSEEDGSDDGTEEDGNEGGDTDRREEKLSAQQQLQLRRQIYQNTTDLGIRLDATRAIRHSPGRTGRRSATPVKPLDLSISHATHVGLPALGRTTEAGIHTVQKALQDVGSNLKPARPIRCGVPVLSISASAYALLEELFVVPISLLSDRYQPLLPETLPRSRLIQLAESRPTGLVTTRYRQELFWRDATNTSAPGSADLAHPDTVVEVETDLLPERSVTARIANTIPVEGEAEPLHVELMLNTASGLSSWRHRAPRAGVALHRRLRDGNAFLCFDSGDWAVWPGETCGFFEGFSRRLNRRFFAADLPLRTAPTLELGYNFSPAELGLLRSGHALTRPADRGLRALDADLDTVPPAGTWTASTALTTHAAAGYLRYARDLPLPALPLAPAHHRRHPSPLRIEAELATSPRPADSYLALRALARVSPHARLGFELALSPAHAHLSLYFSRLGARLRLPLLLASGGGRHPRLLFWGTLVPLAALAAASYLRRWRGGGRGGVGAEALAARVAARRAEADGLTAVLAAGAEPRQAGERAAGGLVVLSAKYGVGDGGDGGGWAVGEEVADVTVAVAALVDGGELAIPAGVRKSRILGFWDPAPLRTKVLEVRYLYRGREGVVRVRGRGGLRVPGEWERVVGPPVGGF